MAVGISEILTFNRKCTVVVGLLFAVIFFCLIMVPSQANNDGGGDGHVVTGANNDTAELWFEVSTLVVVIETSPENMTTNVEIDTNITATFSEPMNSSTLNNSTIKVYIQEMIAGETFEDTVGTWNSTNFQGFIYTEQLEISPQPIDYSNRIIGEGNITYSTQPLLKDYQIYANEGIEVQGLGNYSVMGWLGDECVVIDKWVVSDLVFEQNSTDTKTLHTYHPFFQTWDLGDGYSLKLLELSEDGNEARLALYNSSGEINNSLCQNQSAWIFTTDTGLVDDVTLFVTYLKKVNTTHIELKYTWLMSQDIIEINMGSGPDIFKTYSTYESIYLESDEDVLLTRGTTTSLFDDFKFEVEDTAYVTYRLIHQTETPVEGDIFYNSSSRTVTFDPVSNLNENTDYFSLITTGAKDLAGNGLTEDYIWTFRTVDAAPPKIISVTLNDTVVQTGAPIEVNVSATDENGIVSVTADGIPLIPTGDYYVGTITAGTSPVIVIVTDEAGNLATDTSATYTIDDTEPELALKLITEGNVRILYINSSEPLSNCTVNNVKCTNSSSKNWSEILEDSREYIIIATDFARNEALRNLTLEIGEINETSHNQTNYSTVNVTLNITTTQYVNESNITICEYDENPVGSLNATKVSLLGINKFVQIEVDSELNDSIGTVRISINYSDADLTGIDEDSLKLHVWNASIEKWEELEPSGIDKVKTIVWGELNHLSLFSILGEEPTEEVVKKDNNGGGGGGGASGELYENIACSETDRQYVTQNSDICYSFDLDCNIVQYVNFTCLTSAGRIATKVEILNDTSTLVDNPPSDIVYKNLNIWVGNAGWATERNIDDATVVFTVEKSWITENNIDESSIALYRYSDDTWHKLVTKKIAESANSMQFEAETPGFSPFAVTGKKTGEPRVEGIIEPTVTAEKTPIPKPTEKKGIPGFNIFAGLSVLLIAVQLLRKKE